MLLRVTPLSPFGRKVRMAISRLGLWDRIEWSRPIRWIRLHPPQRQSARQDSDAGHRRRQAGVRQPRHPGISRPCRRRRQDHPDGVAGADRDPDAAGHVRRRHGCLHPDRLRSPPPAGGAPPRAVARLSARQGRARPHRLRQAAARCGAVRRRHHRRGLHARLSRRAKAGRLAPAVPGPGRLARPVPRRHPEFDATAATP